MEFCVIKLKLPEDTLIDLVRNGESGALYGISTKWEFRNGKINYLDNNLPEDEADELCELIDEACPTNESEDEVSYWISDNEIGNLKALASFYAEED